MILNIKKIIVILTIALTLSVLAITRFGLSLEIKYGLPLLYSLRGEIPSPDNVFIITPNRTAAENLEQPALLRNWDRRLHANVIEKASQSGASVIAVDIEFLENHSIEEDEALAQQVKKAKNIILMQTASEKTYGSGEQKYTISLLRNPIDSLVHSATSLAPLPMPVSDSRHDAFWPLFPVISNQDKKECFGYPADANLDSNYLKDIDSNSDRVFVSTMPFAALELFLLNSGFINDEIAFTRKNATAAIYQKECDLFENIRANILKNKDLYTNAKTKSEQIPALKSWINAIQRQEHPIYLNFYGPAKSINTINYHEFLQSNNSVQFNNAFIFLGISDDSKNNQRDVFNTIYTKDEHKLSGVEIAATAFANLYANNHLQRYSKVQLFIATLLVCIVVLIINLRTRISYLVVACLIIFALYLYAAKHQFSAEYFWIPVIWPCFIALPLTLLLSLFDRFYITTKREVKLQDNLRLYLSDIVASQIEKDKEFELKESVCLVTDVQGFTSVGEKLSTQDLHSLNQEYFKLLFDCVSELGADVIKTYGDSLTAVWLVEDSRVYSNAAQAGLNILNVVEKFNQKYSSTPFPTRLGMSSGQIAIGYVGGEMQRTIELTGETVYTASRLEQLNKSKNTKFLATRATIEKANGINYREIGDEILRGKNKVVSLVEVLP